MMAKKTAAPEEPLEVSFNLLDPRMFPDVKAARAFMRGARFGALLEAVDAATCPVEPLTDHLQERATAALWMLAQDLAMVHTLAASKTARSVTATRGNVDATSHELLAILAVIGAIDDAPHVAEEICRLLEEEAAREEDGFSRAAQEDRRRLRETLDRDARKAPTDGATAREGA